VPGRHAHRTVSQRAFPGCAAHQPLRLPGRTLILDAHGLARTLSLPADGNVFQSDIVTSYRVQNGVLHNPKSDRRTSAGTFHIAAGGLPVPADKREVPRATFVRLFALAVAPPPDLLRLPFTAGQPREAHTWLSLLLRPVVCPAVPGFTERLSMETRFFAPGSLVSNLDFVESIFGNAGDPYLAENDAALDVEHWSGHTGCVILATHLQGVRKVDVGLPHVDQATDRQRARACAGHPMTSATTTAKPSSSPAGPRPASSSPSSRTTTTATARRK
jgi:hypothetical protein